MFESVLSTILNTSFEAKGQLKVNKIIKIDIFCWTNDQEDIVKYLFFFFALNSFINFSAIPSGIIWILLERFYSMMQKLLVRMFWKLSQEIINR